MHFNWEIVQLWIGHNLLQMLTWVLFEKPKPSIVNNKPPATPPFFRLIF